MMSAEERENLNDLMAEVQCEKGFSCVKCSLSQLCEGRYYPELDVVECLEGESAPCKFKRPFGCTTVCVCPLRKFIAQNLDRWADEGTDVLGAVAK